MIVGVAVVVGVAVIASMIVAALENGNAAVAVINAVDRCKPPADGSGPVARACST